MSKEDENIEDVLGQLGSFGKYQIRTYAYLAIATLLASMYTNNWIFTSAAMKYRCFVPECESDPSIMLETDWLSNSMPYDGDLRVCTRYAPLTNLSYSDTNQTCSSDMFDHENTIPCDRWVHSERVTVVVELGLQCHSWKRTLIGTIHSVGLLFALPLVGFISDHYGRKMAFVLSAFCAGFLGLIRSFSHSYVMFLLFEFLEPLFGSGVYSSGFILGMELVGPKRRVIGATILCMFYSTGSVVLGAFAWAVPYWRSLLRILYAPSLLFIFYFYIINESVRWLISKGRYEKAIKILNAAAKVNGVTLTEKSMENLYSHSESSKKKKAKQDEESEVSVPETLKTRIFQSPLLIKRVIKCSFWWITCTLVYYGLSINAVALGGNIYMKYIFVSMVEIPAYLVGCLLLDRIGRKYTLSCAYTISGLACITFAFLPKATDVWVSLVVYLLGKFFITMAFGSLYVYTSELFPTCLRHSLLGTCSMIGRIGSIIAPQTPLLGEFMPGLPSFMFGCFSICSGILMLTSPETLNIKLPDTIEEAENLSKHRRKETSYLKHL